MASDMIDVAALGQPFTLGMLYDARKDALIPGLTLWDETTIQKHIVRSSQHNSEFEISGSDSIDSKSSLLDVNASLKASFLCGLIEVEGSAKYLNDTKKFKNQSRVTCQYKATTDFKQLAVIDLVTTDSKQRDVIEKGFATHVVTGILYGVNAFFVFDSEKMEASSVQDVQGSMQAVIKKIPSFNIEGRVDIKLSDEEKALTEKFSCKFYGDFILESNPSTFVEAVKTYTQLPKLLGEHGENGVPLKVWLMPLKNLYPEAPELMSGISDGLVRKAVNVLEDLKEIRMRCNDSLVDKVLENFTENQLELKRFQTLCGYYVNNIQKTMAQKFPLIREGKEDESAAEQVFAARDESPFSHEKLTKWLEDKEREINVIRSCVGTMEGIKIVPNQSALDREVLAPGVEEALCFVFTSMEKGDAYLDEMAKYLDAPELGSTHEEPWYYSGEVFTTMREKAKDFHNLAKGLKNSSRLCFLVAAIANKKYKGATVYHYKEGILVTEDFTKPALPSVENITNRRDLLWYACDLNLDPDTANGWLTLSEGNKKATVGTWQKYPDNIERFDAQPQVLCREQLTGRCYWEVEWSLSSDASVYIAAAYKDIERKSSGSENEFGNTGNTISWCFGYFASPQSPQPELYAWHNGKVWAGPFAGSRIGVYLDWPAGTLSFYKVSSDTLTHLYTFRTTFTNPVYPGFWASKSYNSVYLRPIELEL